jgi:hypothetical protein
MHPGELRINNWLTDSKGKMFRVSAIQNDDDVSDFRAIRLMPEILEKCGFTIEFNRASRSIGTVNSLALEIYPDGSTKLYSDNNNQEALMLPNNIIYLHQLQNLFCALSGEELEVDL